MVLMHRYTAVLLYCMQVSGGRYTHPGTDVRRPHVHMGCSYELCNARQGKNDVCFRQGKIDVGAMQDTNDCLFKLAYGFQQGPELIC